MFPNIRLQRVEFLLRIYCLLFLRICCQFHFCIAAASRLFVQLRNMYTSNSDTAVVRANTSESPSNRPWEVANAFHPPENRTEADVGDETEILSVTGQAFEDDFVRKVANCRILSPCSWTNQAGTICGAHSSNYNNQKHLRDFEKRASFTAIWM